MKLEELHDRLFEVLCTVDDICKKENVRYFLNSGTAIGAAREQDFIPWDDDVDICVLREDYDAFKAAMQKNLPEHYHFVEPKDFAPGFYDFITRVYDDRFYLRTVTDEENYYKNHQNHVGLDVFIYDAAPANALSQKLLILKHKILYGMAMSKRYAIKSENYTAMQKIEVAILCWMGKAVTVEWLCDRWEKVAAHWKGKETGYLIPSNFSMNELHVISSKIYHQTVYLDFHGRKMPLPAGYDEELTILYGDYMHPPKDKSKYRTHLEKTEE